MNGVATSLKLQTGATTSGATSINDAGQIVGWDNLTKAEFNVLYWKSASSDPIVLPIQFIPAQIGKNGDVVGWVYTPPTPGATGTVTYYRYNVNTSTGPVAIATESLDASWTPAIAVNASGTVVLRTPGSAEVVPLAGPEFDHYRRSEQSFN